LPPDARSDDHLGGAKGAAPSVDRDLTAAFWTPARVRLGDSRRCDGEISAFTGLTTKKNTTKAMVTKAIRAFRKSPYRNTDPLIVKLSWLKSGWPKMAAIRG
jgi:hypothetical protein